MIRFTLYVVDDEESIRKGISLSFKRDYKVKTFPTAESVLRRVEEEAPDLILLDIGLPGVSGIEALEKIKGINPDILVIMVTAYEEIQTVISAMKLGAYDYVVKPIHMDSLRVTVRNALETVRMKKEIQALQDRYLRENLPCFIGESNAVQDMMHFVRAVAKSADTPILIIGESGTGKELIAQAVHYRSPLYRGPFVPINCASIPKELVESELFGYEKGAFSGARTSGKRGLVEEAGDGTLFLDEVGDLSLEAQAKLLRFLETGEYYRVGSTKKHRVRTRVVSATNRDLIALIEKGLFREDLYYRLAVVKVEVPSLNDRKEDIPPIAGYLLEQISQRLGKRFSGISPEAEEMLKKHNWRGNVRELRNVIERAVLTSTGEVLMPSDLGIEERGGASSVPPESINGPFPPLPAGGVDLAALEDHYMSEALKRSGGNAVEAARLLGMSYYAFRYRLRKRKLL